MLALSRAVAAILGGVVWSCSAASFAAGLSVPHAPPDTSHRVPWREVVRFVPPLGSIAVVGGGGAADEVPDLGGVGLGVIAPNGIWTEASVAAFYKGYSVVDLSIIGGYAFGYTIEPGTWDFSVPVFVGYTALEHNDLFTTASEHVNLVSCGTRAVWSYTTASERATLELAFGVSVAKTFSRNTMNHAFLDIEYWVKPSFFIGVGF